MADFGYDVADYCALEPIFGTLEDFDNLVAQAHNRGIKVIMDFVPNHTSNEHRWFLESRSNRNNPKRDWYIWTDGRDDHQPPNNWLSVFGGSGWEFDQGTGQYYYHSFLKQQPDLNWHNPEVVEAMHGVLKFWLERGVDGFRTDAVRWLIKDKELRDNPVNPNYTPGKQDPYHQFLNIYTQGQPETLKLINGFCQLLSKYDDAFMVTELHGDIELMKKYFRACENGKHSPFNFNLIGLAWDAVVYKKFVDDFEAALEPQDWPNYVLGNHDQPRVASRLGQMRARAAALLQFTLRGMPFVYYGEEIGMENGVIPPELVQDPFEKRVPGLGLGRDSERTPMQWSSQEYGGFSTVQPWLPVADNYQSINIEGEKADPKSMLALYRLLIHFRNNSPVLLHGSYRSADVKNDKIFVFERSLNSQTLVTLINFSDQLQEVKIGEKNTRF
jgi:alpha-glucosidase